MIFPLIITELIQNTLASYSFQATIESLIRMYKYYKRIMWSKVQWNILLKNIKEALAKSLQVKIDINTSSQNLRTNIFSVNVLFFVLAARGLAGSIVKLI